MSDARAKIVAEAMRWHRTPYRHCADVLGVGTDCAMMLVRVYQACGLAPAEFDPRPYAPDWFLHRDEERYLAGMEKYSHRVDVGLPGDIAVYRFGRTASHGAIIVDADTVIHAYRPERAVVLTERARIQDRFDSYYSVFPAAT